MAIASKASVAAAISITALACFAAPNAEAIQVVVGGNNYDVTTFSGTPLDNAAKFNSTEMPWLGNGTLAEQFAAALGSAFGYPNPAFFVGLGNYGPLFAYQGGASGNVTSKGRLSNGFVLDNTNPSSQSLTYAIVNPPPPSASSVPGPLPLFGAAAAFGWSRRLRSRLGARRNWELN